MNVTCNVAPSVEFTFVALRLVELTEKPVPEMATVVADVSPVPLTTIDFVTDVLAVVEPKSTVEPLVGDVIDAVDVDVDAL